MFEGIDPSIALPLETFVANPSSLAHLLFVCPPGSGKTTTANTLVKAFYKGRKTFTGKALFLNSSDERSLEAVRSKVYPFARSQIHILFGVEKSPAPKILVFDEAETLTEQAQSALRPLLDRPASELLILFLCNSISKIHSSILHRFLRISFETPTADQFRDRFQPIFGATHEVHSETRLQEIAKTISPCDIAYRRGDIRFFLLQYSKARECNTFGWLLLHLPKHEVGPLVEKMTQTISIGEVIGQALFVFQSIGVIEPEDISSLLSFGDSDLLSVRPLAESIQDCTAWILQRRDKFEATLVPANG